MAVKAQCYKEEQAPRPILRKGPSLGLVRSREEACLDDGADQELMSPGGTKRQRVTFSSDIDVRLMPNMTDSALETDLIGEEVRKALELKGLGDPSEYERVKAIFTGHSYTEDLCNPRLYENHILALTRNVSLLSGKCDSLVKVLLQFNWLARDRNFVRLYLQFLGHLASSYSGYLPSILRMLLRNFNRGMVITTEIDAARHADSATVHSHAAQSSSQGLSNCPSEANVLQSTCCDWLSTSTHSFSELLPSCNLDIFDAAYHG